MKIRETMKLKDGFTILEILVSISLAMILLGIGIGFTFQAVSIEKKFNRIAGKVEVAARQASITSIVERRDVFLTIFEKSVIGLGDRVEFGDAKLSIQFPGRLGRWSSPPGSGYLWKFDANGLVEPIRLKLAFAEGEVTMIFDPLTGEVRDRTMIIFE